MEHDFLCNKQLRRKITARAVIDKTKKKLQSDKDKNNEKLDNIPRKINRIKEAIRMKRRKGREHLERSFRINKLKNSKTEIKIKIDAINQIILHIREVKDQFEAEIKRIEKTENLPMENPFDFTGSLKKREKENERDSSQFFFEVVDENKIIYNQAPVNTFMEDMEKLKNGFF